MDILTHIIYVVVLLLMPTVLLLAADLLAVTHVHLTYARLLLGIFLGFVVGSIFWSMGVFIALGAAFLATLIWIKIQMNTRWHEVVFMNLFAWMIGGLLIWSLYIIMPLSWMQSEPMVTGNPYPSKVVVRHTSQQCIDISYNEIIKTEPEVRFEKLLFEDEENVDGKSRYCDVYYLTPKGGLLVVIMENNRLSIRELEMNEIDKILYEERFNPSFINSLDIVQHLDKDEDYRIISDSSSLSFSGIHYEKPFDAYVWQVTVGNWDDLIGKTVFSLNAVTGEVLKKERVERELNTGKLVHWKYVEGEWVKK